MASESDPVNVVAKKEKRLRGLLNRLHEITGSDGKTKGAPPNWIARNYPELGEFFGVQQTTVAHWKARPGCPINRPPYHLDKIVQWLRKEGPWRIRTAGPDDPTGDPLLTGGTSPALERYREQRARLAEMDVEAREKSLLPREKIREVFIRMSVLMRQAGEQLLRQYGEGAYRILEDAITNGERELDALCDLPEEGAPE